MSNKQEITTPMTLQEKVLVKEYSINNNERDINIKVYKISDKNAEVWKDNRNIYIGSSEVGILLGVSSYSNHKKLLLKKLGHLKETTSNQMYIGLIYERYIGEIACYYDTDIETTYKNVMNNNVVRTLVFENSYYEVHLSYTNEGNTYATTIMVSPDFYFEQNGQLYPLDTKFLDVFSYNSKQFSGNIPDYVWQSFMQCLVYDSPKGYLFYQIGNSNMQMIEVDRALYEHFLVPIIDECVTFYEVLEEYKNKPLGNILKEYMPHMGVDMQDIAQSSYQKLDDIIDGDVADEIEIQKYLYMNGKKKEIEAAMDEIKTYIFNKYNEYNKVNLGTYVVSLKPFRVNTRRHTNDE